MKKRKVYITYNRLWNEYIVMVVNEKGNIMLGECYHTDDKEDAIGTMQQMKKEYVEKGYVII